MRTHFPRLPLALRAGRFRKRPAARRLVAAAVLLGIGGAVAGAFWVASDPIRLARWFSRVEVTRAGGYYEGDEGVFLQQGLTDCGPAALANLLRVVGLPALRPDSIGVLAGTGPTGTLASGLVRAAGELGLPLRFSRLWPQGLAQVPAPMIAWVRRSHFVTVAERTPNGRLVVLDPQVGRYSISEEAFKAIWSGEAILLGGQPRSPAARAVAGLVHP